MYLIRALAGVVVTPRAPNFNVTQKGAVLDDALLSVLALPFYVIFGVLAAGAVYTVMRYVAEPASRDLLIVVGAWNIFNLVMAGIALGCVSERRERRKVQRLETSRPGELTINGETIAVTVTAASIGGVKLVANGLFKQPISRCIGRNALPAPSIRWDSARAAADTACPAMLLGCGRTADESGGGRGASEPVWPSRADIGARRGEDGT